MVSGRGRRATGWACPSAASLGDVIVRMHDEVKCPPLVVEVFRQHGVGLAFLQAADEVLHQCLLFRRWIRIEKLRRLSDRAVAIEENPYRDADPFGWADAGRQRTAPGEEFAERLGIIVA